MFLNKLDFEIPMQSSFQIAAKPFEETQMKQFKILPFEKHYGKIDLEKLNDIDKWYEKLLSKLNESIKKKKEALVKVLMQRIEEAKTLLQNRYEESGVMFIKNGWWEIK